MGAKRIDPERARELLEQGDHRYLDVRMPEEFEAGHVPEATNIPFMVRGPGGAGIFPNQQFADHVESQFEKGERIILGCQKGGRSNRAASVLVERGFENIFDMRGGYVGETDPFGNLLFPGWTAKGYPVTK